MTVPVPLHNGTPEKLTDTIGKDRLREKHHRSREQEVGFCICTLMSSVLNGLFSVIQEDHFQQKGISEGDTRVLEHQLIVKVLCFMDSIL
jgi:hypothetical protein